MRTLADGRRARRPAPSLEELRERRDEVFAVARGHGASDVRVFGSVASGVQDDESDLDLLVDFDAAVSLFTWARLIRELEELLGCAVDVVEIASLKERMRNEVVAQAVPL